MSANPNADPSALTGALLTGSGLHQAYRRGCGPVAERARSFAGHPCHWPQVRWSGWSERTARGRPRCCAS